VYLSYLSHARCISLDLVVVLDFIILIIFSNEYIHEALGYGLNDRGSRARFPVGAGKFSLHHRVQNGSGSHPACYPMDTRGCLPGSKAAGARSWPLNSI
jgi:hypothetical protein